MSTPDPAVTAPEPPASLLRRAADELESRAAATTGDWWEAVENYPGAWVVRPRWTQPSIPHRGVRNLPEASSYVASESSQGDIEEGDVKWMAALGPQVAAPLAAWLRAEADLAEVVDRRPGPIADMTGMGSTSLAPFGSPALTLARVLLHEEAS